MEKPNVIEYIDYRTYLKDLFAYKKYTTKSFSHRQLAASLSLASPGFISEVIRGKKRLSQKLIIKLTEVMKLEGVEFTYFQSLVKFNQAKWPEEKDHYFNQLSQYNKSKACIIHNNKEKYYTKWYYSAVWNYVGMHPGKSLPKDITKEFFPSLSEEQVKESLQLLLDLELIKTVADGYQVTNHHIVSEKPFHAQTAKNYTFTLINLAKQALGIVPEDARQYNVMMFSISQVGMQAIKQRINFLMREVRDIVDGDKKEDRIYSMCLQLFPNSSKSP